jgi:hypothetical protein
MAWHFRGTISGVAYSEAQNLPMNVNSFLVVNNIGSPVEVNVFIYNQLQATRLMPRDKQLDSGESYESTRQVVMLPTEILVVQSTGSVDYDFYIDNMAITENNISV